MNNTQGKVKNGENIPPLSNLISDRGRIFNTHGAKFHFCSLVFTSLFRRQMPDIPSIASNPQLSLHWYSIKPRRFYKATYRHFISCYVSFTLACFVRFLSYQCVFDHLRSGSKPIFREAMR